MISAGVVVRGRPATWDVNIRVALVTSCEKDVMYFTDESSPAHLLVKNWRYAGLSHRRRANKLGRFQQFGQAEIEQFILITDKKNLVNGFITRLRLGGVAFKFKLLLRLYDHYNRCLVPRFSFSLMRVVVVDDH